MLEKIGTGRRNSCFFPARHRMAADEVCAPSAHQSLQFPHDASFYTAYVGDYGPAFQCRKELSCQDGHLGQRSAENYEVGAGNGRKQVGGCVVCGGELLALRNALRAAHIAGNLTGEPPLPHRQAKRTAKQADPDEGDFLEMHRESIAGPGVRMEVGNCSCGAGYG